MSVILLATPSLLPQLGIGFCASPYSVIATVCAIVEYCWEHGIGDIGSDKLGTATSIALDVAKILLEHQLVGPDVYKQATILINDTEMLGHVISDMLALARKSHLFHRQNPGVRATTTCIIS